jgi:hypothetical protein
LAALFDGVRPGSVRAILDLGPARQAHIQLLGRFARQLRFAHFVNAGNFGETWADAIRDLPGNPEAPYDIVLAWDVLDRLGPDDRAALIARLAEVTAPRARVFFLIDASGAPVRPPRTFTLTEATRVVQTDTGPAQPAFPELLPAAVERLLGPFEVMNAFYVRGGWREYVAVKRR